VAVLVTAVVEQTSAGDAWYGHCEQVLSWSLESLGVHEERTGTIVEAAIGGRFESWVGPDQGVVDDLAQKIGQGLDVSFYLRQKLTELETGLEIGELGPRSGAVKASPTVPSKTNVHRERDYLPQ
jgi:hypothetical protein